MVVLLLQALTGQAAVPSAVPCDMMASLPRVESNTTTVDHSMHMMKQSSSQNMSSPTAGCCDDPNVCQVDQCASTILILASTQETNTTHIKSQNIDHSAALAFSQYPASLFRPPISG